MKSQLIVITGASSGIGAAMAKVFAQANYNLGLIARNITALEELKLPNSIYLAADVSDIAQLKAAIEKVEEKFGAVDCLVNNAGVGVGGDFVEVSHQDHAQMVAINLQGVINGIEIILPKMRQQQTGTIINISSVADRHSRPMLATYAATKAAVKSLTESLRAANAEHNIRICNLAPAKIATSMLKSSVLADSEVIDPIDFAKAVLWVYQQPQGICIRDMVFAPTKYPA